jgi:hypothetical protein
MRNARAILVRVGPVIRVREGASTPGPALVCILARRRSLLWPARGECTPVLVVECILVPAAAFILGQGAVFILARAVEFILVHPVTVEVVNGRSVRVLLAHWGQSGVGKTAQTDSHEHPARTRHLKVG